MAEDVLNTTTQYASRVIVENGRAAGVQVFSPDKRSHTLRAKNIVLSCSTLETPRILLNSGIQGPAIGRYLTGHVSMIGIGTISRRQFSDKLGNLSILEFETDESTLALRPPGADMHEANTCRMGVDPATSATNLNGQVHGVPGLFVADNSVLPSLTGSGAVISNVALAIRLADYIK